MSDRAAVKAKTHLNVALTHLEEAARLTREAGLHRPADTLERLARNATEALGKLPAPSRPHRSTRRATTRRRRHDR